MGKKTLKGCMVLEFVLMISMFVVFQLKRLTKVLKRIQTFGLKLMIEKCQFEVKVVLFLGDKLSAEEMKPDEGKRQCHIDYASAYR